MDRKEDSSATLTPIGKSGPSAQDQYCARGLEREAKQRRGNGEECRQV